MAWTLGGTRVYVIDEDETSKQEIARLQPLTSGTIHHIFGWDDPIIKINGKVVGLTNLNALREMRTTGVTTTLSGDIENRTVLVSSLSFKRNRAYWQTLDITQDCTAPVFDVDIELYEEI